MSDKMFVKQTPMLTEDLMAILEKHPRCAVMMQETDYRLVPVQSAEFVAYAIGPNSNGYVWIQT